MCRTLCGGLGLVALPFCLCSAVFGVQAAAKVVLHDVAQAELGCGLAAGAAERDRPRAEG